MCVLININVCFFSFLSLCLLSPAVMPRFTEQVESAVEALSANPSQPVDENEFIDASRLVYDGIRDIRKAVLMIRVSCVVFVVSASTLQTKHLNSLFFTWNFCSSSNDMRELSCFVPSPELKSQNRGVKM